MSDEVCIFNRGINGQAIDKTHSCPRCDPETYGYQPEWQPIETAPKDKDILIAYYKGKSSVWGGRSKQVFVTQARLSTDWGKLRWVDYTERQIMDTTAKKTSNTVVAWMPLPTPPERNKR